MSQEQNDFAKFVKERFGVLLTVISSMPLLANYFEIFKLDPKFQKSVVLMTTLFCGLIFFVLQSKRYAIAGRHNKSWLVVGLIASAIGTALFFVSLTFIEILDSHKVLQAVVFFFTFLFLLNGAAILLLQIFVNEEERKQLLFEVVAVLNHDQWVKFIPFCKAFLGIKDRNPPPTPVQKRAFSKSRDHIVNLTADMFSKINEGTFEILGKEMDKVYGFYMEAVSREFCATSYNDLEYWTKEESRDYFNSNAAIVKRGCSAERIFIVENKEPLKKAEEVIRKQIVAGINVRILFINSDLNKLYSKVDLDFGIFDDFAVSSWNFIRDRVFRMTEREDDLKKFKKIYDDLKPRCELVVKDRRVFQTEEEFVSWLDR